MTLSPAPTAGTSDISVYDRLESRVRSYSRAMPRQFVRAEGPWMHDTEGGRYLDFLSGCSTLNYGHNHPVLKQALMRSEERRVGKEGVSKCRSGWSPDH